jgi:hypothetical protein
MLKWDCLEKNFPECYNEINAKFASGELSFLNKKKTLFTKCLTSFNQFSKLDTLN